MRLKCLFGFVFIAFLLTFNLFPDGKEAEITITYFPDSLSNKGRGKVVFETDKETEFYECRFNDEKWQRCLTEKFFNGLEDGKHSFHVRAAYKDTEGEIVYTEAVEKKWTIDTTPPVTEITKTPEKITNSNKATFVFSANEKSELFCSKNNKKWKKCSSPFKIKDISDGKHSFFVKAIDEAGNEETNPPSFSWTVDTKEPETEIIKAPKELTRRKTAVFSFKSNKKDVEFQCNIDGKNWSECREKYGPFEDGEHKLAARSIDSAGNIDSKGAFHNWRVDTKPPKIKITEKPASLTNEKNLIFSFTADEKAEFLCKINSGKWEKCKSKKSYSSLKDGRHCFMLKASDEAGNTVENLEKYCFVTDTLPPETKITEKPDSPTSSRKARFSFSGSSDIAEFHCSIDDSSWRPCKSESTFTGMSAGKREFRVRAIDKAGNVEKEPVVYKWVVDFTPPETEITGDYSKITNSSSIKFEFSASEKVSHYLCSLDDEKTKKCGKTKKYSELKEGPHTLKVAAVDKAGNKDRSPAKISWTNDYTPPKTSISADITSPVNVDSVNFSLSADEKIQNFQCKFNSGKWKKCKGKKTYQKLEEGKHIFMVRAIDKAGNIEKKPASFRWKIDITPPGSEITKKPEKYTSSQKAVFSFSGSPDTDYYQCKINDEKWQKCSRGISFSPLKEGDNKFYVRSVDKAGNVEKEPSEYLWTVDTTPPKTRITEKPPELTNSRKAVFSFSADEESSFLCSLNKDDRKECKTGHTLSIKKDGIYEFSVAAVDRAGNIDKNPPSFKWRVDTTPPELKLTETPKKLTNLREAKFSVEASEKASSFSCKLNDGKWEKCGATKKYSELKDGKYFFQIQATDMAGNKTEKPLTFSWTIDTVPPVVTITKTPPERTNSQKSAFSFKADKNIDKFLCRHNDKIQQPCKSAHIVDKCQEGKHKFEVTAIDIAGNKSEKATSFSWHVDLTPPKTKILEKPKDFVSHKKAKISFKADEPHIAFFRCRLNQGNWKKCKSPFSVSGLKEGFQKLMIEAEDKAENKEKNPAEIKWTVDITPPESKILSGPDKLTSSTKADFKFKANEEGSLHECKIDSDPWKSCKTKATYNKLPEGKRSFYLRAKDRAGNLEKKPAVFNWEIDRTPPESEFIETPPELTNKKEHFFEFKSSEPVSHFLCRINKGNWKKCGKKFKTPSLEHGEHLLEVKAIDKAGNQEKKPVNYKWTVDLKPPVTKIVKAPSVLTGKNTAEFFFNADEKVSSFNCSINGEAWKPCKKNPKFTKFSEGKHNLRVYSVDKAGNREKKPVEFSWTIDTTPPTTSIVPQTAELTSNTELSLKLKCNESECNFQYRLDGEKWKKTGNTLFIKNIKEGRRKIEVRASDAVGNLEKKPAGFSWAVDLTPPKVEIRTKPSLLTNKPVAEFVFSADEKAKFVYSLNDSAWKKTPEKLRLQKLKDGKHTIKVKAEDMAGNLSKKPVGFSWTVDTTPPSTEFISTPDRYDNSKTTLFKFKSNEKNVRYMCRINKEEWEPCRSEKKVKNLNEGSHSFYVKATDPAGNEQKKPLSYRWTVDMTPPDTKIEKTPPRLTNKQTVSFMFSSDEKHVEYQCTIDESDWFKCSTGQTVKDMGEGSHSFVVRAVDRAGNKDNSPAVFSWEIDLTPPETSFTETPEKYSISTSAEIAFKSDTPHTKFFCSLDNTPWKNCESPVNFENLSEGDHMFKVTAEDRAGNRDKTPATYSWLIPFQFINTSAAYQHTCSIGASGILYCWGSNSLGQLGIKDEEKAQYLIPTPITSGNLKWKSVSSGKFHSCGITTEKYGRKLYCWGGNGYGQLGSGRKENHRVPTAVKGNNRDWLQISGGGQHTCGIKKSGGKNLLYCWGNNSSGQIGDNSTDNKLTPVQPNSKKDGWVAVSSGFLHTCGIRENKGKRKLYCWGNNSDGQLGNGKISEKTTSPVEVKGSHNDWKSVASGNFHTCGIRDNNGQESLYCWGYNGNGQLGDGSIRRKNIPTSISFTNNRWKYVDTGFNHSCAIRKENGDRKLYCWGYNYHGQLGNASVSSTVKPKVVSGNFKDWYRISLGDNHSCGVRKQKGRYQLYCWGRGSFGQIGDGFNEQHPEPREVTGKKSEN